MSNRQGLHDFNSFIFDNTFDTPDDLFKIAPEFKKYFVSMEEADLRAKKPHEELRLGLAEMTVLPLTETVRYIVLMFNPNNDLFKKYPDDYELRKEAAAKNAGFKREKGGQWPWYVQHIMRYENVSINRWIHDYLAAQKNRTWREIQLLEQEIDKLYLKRSKSIELEFDDIKSEKAAFDIVDQIEKLTGKLELQLAKYYAGNADFQKKDEFKLLPISPENVFKQLQVPEEWYKIKQIKDLKKKDVQVDS